MNITLKNIKFSGFATQETHCFEATVYVDGKRSFMAFNDGRGGCNGYHPFKGQPNIWPQIKVIQDEIAKIPLDPPYEHLDNDLDMVICELVNDWLLDKEIKKDLKKVCFVNNGSIFTCNLTNAEFKARTEGITKVLLKDKPNAVILNALPFDEAKKLWLEAS